MMRVSMIHRRAAGLKGLSIAEFGMLSRNADALGEKAPPVTILAAASSAIRA